MIRQVGSVQSNLAAGVVVTEEFFEVRIPFDGCYDVAEATFVDGENMLIGTHLMRDYRLMMNFPQHQMELQRTAS